MKKFTALMLALMMSLSLVACGNKTDDSNNADDANTDNNTEQTGGTLVLGTSADYAPYEFMYADDSGTMQYAGIDISAGQYIADELGKELQVENMSFDYLLTSLAKGDFDIVMAAIEVTPERLQSADFSDPYYTDLPAMILVKADAADQYNTLADFAGKSVGAQTATTKEAIVTDQMEGANLVSLSLVTDLVNELVYGKVDAIVVDGAVAEQYAESNPDLAVPQSGSYTIGESADYPAFSINSDSYDTYLNRYDANGNVTETSFTAGTMEIAYEDGIYTIECKMTTESEEEYEFTYVGPIPFYNRAGEGEMSNLTDNVEISGLTQGMALYEPEAFTTTSDLYMVILAGEDYDLETNFGQADALQISVNVTPGSNDGIPTGTYTIVDMNEVDDLEPETAIAGLYEYGGYYGTWYYSTGKHIESAMKEGTVEIENEGLDFYTINATFKDGYGHQVKASYSGKLLFATVEY